MLGLLKVRVMRGLNLAIRDVYFKRSSDPFVCLRMGDQKVRTKVIKKNLNPEWNDELTLAVKDPTLPVRLEVYDKDTFSKNDPMGRAEFDIQPFLEVVKKNLKGAPNGIIIKKVKPNRQNCLTEESAIHWSDGKVIQDMLLRLRDVECGEIELQLEWVSNPGARV